MTIWMAIFRRVGALAALFFVLLSASHTDAATTMSLATDRSPSVAGDTVTFSAYIQPTPYSVCVPVGYSLAFNQTAYIRFDIPGSVFAQTALNSDLTNITAPADLQLPFIAQGGTTASSSVVYVIQGGPSGMPATDVLCFHLPGVTVTAAGSVPQVAYSLHLTPISAAVGTPFINNARVVSYGPVPLVSYATVGLFSTVVRFQLDGVDIPACTTSAVVAGEAHCPVAIGSAGVHAVSAFYGFAGNPPLMSASLAGGQVVALQSQFIDFTLPATALTGAQITLNGAAGSGLLVSYTVNNPQVCALQGSVLRLLAAGTCSVTASQAGDAQHAAAASVTRTIAVSTNPEPFAVHLRSATGLSMTGSLSGGQIVFSTNADPGPGYRLLGSADFDGDGTPDLLFLNTSQGAFGDVHVWKNFSSSADVILRNVKLAWDVQVLGDLDGDGYADLVWRYTAPDSPDTGVSYIWFSNGSGVSEVRKRGGAPLDWALAGARDLNGDGAADMVYVSPTGQIRVLMATAARSCANFSAGALPAGFAVLHFADYTGNQRGDLLLKNSATGEVRLLSLDARALTMPPSTADPNDPNASCTATTASLAVSQANLPAVPSDWSYFASADLNGDGISDIVWRLSDGTLTIWTLGAGGVLQSVIGNAGTVPAGFTVQSP